MQAGVSPALRDKLRESGNMSANASDCWGEKRSPLSLQIKLINPFFEGVCMKLRGKTIFVLMASLACLVMFGLSGEAAQTLPASDQKQTPIPFNRLGAEIDQKYGGQATGAVATERGYRLAAKMQSLVADVTAGGLTVTSIAKSEGAGSFSVLPVAVNGVKAQKGGKPVAGSASDGTVTLDRGIISERFSASTDGIRQDFIIPAPARQGKTKSASSELMLTLAVKGAKLSNHEKAQNAVLLTLPTGRKLVYNRLRVTDAQGRELPARMGVKDASELQIIVAASGATYPVTIDPTITDDDWFVMNPGIPGMDRGVSALALDSAGNLYAGGDFTIAGGAVANSIAKWNGSSWSALGSGIDGSVFTLAMDAAGNLYAGGVFKTAGGIAANSIAKWNGSSWSALGSGIAYSSAWINTLAIDAAGNLYAAGFFTSIGGVAVSNIAKWNGSNWSALGSGMEGSSPVEVHAMVIDAAGNLYAGGNFTAVGGVVASKIAKWNGANWSALGSGVNGDIRALAMDAAGNLYAGGGFMTAGGIAASKIAKWDGANWSALGSGMNVSVEALAMDSAGNLYAGGSGMPFSGVRYIAKWDGSGWSTLDVGTNRNVSAMVIDAVTGNLYAGGYFSTAGGVAANYIAKWDGTNWSALGPKGINNYINALAIDASGNLYAGGEFTTAVGVVANSIAKWDGSSWSALGAGVDNSINALAMDSAGNLYAGGAFWTAGGVAAMGIAKWDGTNWSALGSGVQYVIDALAMDTSGNLYAGGDFASAGGVAASKIAKWDGTSWSALGSGMDYSVHALAIDASGNVYAGGDFGIAGGVAARGIAKWNGTSWSALGPGLDSSVHALAIDASGTLYAGGPFMSAGEVPAQGIAKWNGTSWSALGSGMEAGNFIFDVYALYIDASGTLYAGGDFKTAGGVVANSIAKWDGTSWSALGSGVEVDGAYSSYFPSVNALAIDASGTLYAGGDFGTAGGKLSPYIARCKVSDGWTTTTSTSAISTTTTTTVLSTTTSVISSTSTSAAGELTTTTTPSLGSTTTSIGGATTTAPLTTTAPVTTSAISSTTTADGESSSTTSAPPASTTTTSTGGENTTTTTVSGTTTTTACPATKVLGADNPKLKNLRNFRDSKLAQSAVGRRIINVYYNKADSINAALERNPALRATARRMLEVIAPMVGKEK